jgi:hypothetical protein
MDPPLYPLCSLLLILFCDRFVLKRFVGDPSVLSEFLRFLLGDAVIARGEYSISIINIICIMWSSTLNYYWQIFLPRIFSGEEQLLEFNRKEYRRLRVR